MNPLPLIRHAVERPLRSMVMISLLSLAMLAGCSSNATDPGTTPTSTTENPPEGLYAQWDYIGATLWDPDGKATTVSVGGDLTLKSDRTWSQVRVIGGIGASGNGTFTVKGDTLRLKHTDNSQDLVYTFALGSEADPAGGTRKTLVLSSMKVQGESWFDYALREHKP
jgi:hypothetical protein